MRALVGFVLVGLMKLVIEKENSSPASSVEPLEKESVINSSLLSVLQVSDEASFDIPAHVGLTGAVIESGTLIYILSPSVSGDCAINVKVYVVVAPLTVEPILNAALVKLLTEVIVTVIPELLTSILKLYENVSKQSKY